MKTNSIEVVKSKGVIGENEWTVYKDGIATRTFNELSCDYAYSNLCEYLEEMEAKDKQTEALESLKEKFLDDDSLMSVIKRLADR